MSDELFDVILFGRVKEGADPAEVKARLAKVLKIDEEKAGALISSGKNSRLLRAVSKDQADKYYKVLSSCGAVCNVAPSAGKPLAALAGGGGGGDAGAKGEGGGAGGASGGGGGGGLALEPMTEGMRTFTCPSCGHKEEMLRSVKVEKCPACGTDVKKALEKQEADEAEARVRQHKAAAEKQRLKEYEDRLRIELEKQIRARLEEEIRKELGVAGGAQGGFWGMFMRNKAVVGLSVVGGLVGISVALTLGIKSYLDAKAEEELAAAPPTPEMEAIAPAVAAVASAQSPQVQQAVQEMAQVTNAMAPPAQQPQVNMQAMSAAGMQMMKGMDPGAFMAMAATTQMMGNMMGPLAAMGGLPVGGGSGAVMAMPGMSGGAGGMMMGMPGVADQLGMGGMGQIPVDQFKDMMAGMSAPAPGQITTMGMVSGNQVILGQMPILDGTEAPTLESMTPAQAVQIVDGMTADREWGRFVATRVGELADRDAEAAGALATLIPTPYERAAARARIAVALLDNGLDAAARLMAEQGLDELDEIQDVDVRAQAAVALGDLLARAGQQAVPADVRQRLSAQVERTLLAEERSALLGRIAVSHYVEGNLDAADESIDRAVEAASGIESDRLRLSTFMSIAERYADMSATPIAHTVTNEAALRARDLAPEDRAAVFVASAKARAYMGDTERAARDINLVGEGVARDQALTAVIEHLIIANEAYRAAEFIDALEDPLLHAQLNLELVSQLLSDDVTPFVLQRLEQAQTLTDAVTNPESRALLYSRLARLQVRVGQVQASQRNFTLALEGARVARSQSQDLMHANIAVDQAYALQLADARTSASRISEPVLRDRMTAFLDDLGGLQGSAGLTDPAYALDQTVAAR